MLIKILNNIVKKIKLYLEKRQFISLKKQHHLDDIKEMYILFGKAINNSNNITINELKWASYRENRRNEIVAYYSSILSDLTIFEKTDIFFKKSSLKYSIAEIRLSLLSMAKFTDSEEKNKLNSLYVGYIFTNNFLNDKEFYAAQNWTNFKNNILLNRVVNIEYKFGPEYLPDSHLYQIEDIKSCSSCLSPITIKNKLLNGENPFV